MIHCCIPQALTFSIELPDIAEATLHDVLEILNLLPFLDGFGGVYDKEIVVQACDVLLPLCQKQGMAHLALVAKACFSPNVTKLEQEACINIVGSNIGVLKKCLPKSYF